MAYSIFGTQLQSVKKGDIDLLRADKLSKSGGTLYGHLHVHSKDVNIARIGNDKDVIMCRKQIKDLHNPTNPQDAVTKYYADNLVQPQKCHVGYIPANIDETGFIASASGEHSADYKASNAFNGKHGTEWVPSMGISTDFWIMIQCPEQVRVWRTSLRGRDNVKDNVIQQWSLDASNDNVTWTNLLTTGGHPLTRTCQYFSVDTQQSFNMYRIYCDRATGNSSGLSHWQLYVYNS